MRRTPLAALPFLLAALLAPAAQAADTNHDRIPDRWERTNHLSLKVDQRDRDQDHDRLTNLYEYRSHTNPRSSDSDHDGVKDAKEDADRDGKSNLTEQRHAEKVAAAKEQHAPGEDDTSAGDDDAPAATVPDDDDAAPAPGAAPVDEPGEQHGDEPGEQPGDEQGEQPGDEQGEQPSDEQGEQPDDDAPVPPAEVPAPQSGGTIASFTGGVLTIDRPNGFEHPAAPLAENAAITCVHVHAGAVTSSAPCATTDLVAGRGVGVTQREVSDGQARWTRIDVVIAE